MRALCKLLGKFSIVLVLVEMIAGGQALQAAGERGVCKLLGKVCWLWSKKAKGQALQAARQGRAIASRECE